MPLLSFIQRIDASPEPPSHDLVDSSGPFAMGDPADTITAPLEPFVLLRLGDDSLSPLRKDGSFEVAIVYVSPVKMDEEVPGTISDPLESLNRTFFKFNDKLYFWVLKPVSQGYKAVVPEDARVGVRNFFSNVTTPGRLVNCLLQADFKCGGTEILRLLVNSTFGLAGFLDTAKKEFHLEKQDRDFGQTLGIYGIGFGFYINWPIFGPSSVRDTVGLVGDLFLDPRTYILSDPIFYVLTPVELINETSLRTGEYEDLKESAIDPYVALKDAYYQYRKNKIRQR